MTNSHTRSQKRYNEAHRELHREQCRAVWHRKSPEERAQLAEKKRIEYIERGQVNIPEYMMCAFMTGKTSDERGKTECDE